MEGRKKSLRRAGRKERTNFVPYREAEVWGKQIGGEKITQTRVTGFDFPNRVLQGGKYGDALGRIVKGGTGQGL